MFFAPDYFGSAQYIQYFSHDGRDALVEARRRQERRQLINAKEGDLLKQALAAPEAEKDKFYHDIAMEMINDRVIIPLVSPNVVLAHAQVGEGRALQRLLQPAARRDHARVAGDFGNPHRIRFRRRCTAISSAG